MCNPTVTMVLPAHNEAAWLEGEARDLSRRARETLPDLAWDVLIVENGSTDDTARVASSLADGDERITAMHLERASYGSALKEGIARARGDVVALFNVDLWDLQFLAEALELLNECDLVIGSKLARGGGDRRPIVRRLISRALNSLLRAAFGFDGTDTHGMKAFWRDKIAPLAAECVTDGEVFDTEFVLRAQRAGLRVRELPVVVQEKRPARTGLFRRGQRAIRELGRLWIALRREDADTTGHG